VFHNRLMVTGAKTTFTNGSIAGPLQTYIIIRICYHYPIAQKYIFLSYLIYLRAGHIAL